MSNHWKDDWQELHHGEKEYCRESGPLNSRKISAAKAKNLILANGLGLVASTLAAVGLAVAIATLYITSAPVAIGEHNALVNVSVHNRQEDEKIEYVLSKAADPDTPIDAGVIEPDEESLEFDDLESNTAYIIEYFAEREGVREKVGEFRFTTDGPMKETTSTPAGTDPPETSQGDPLPPATTGEDEETREQYEETTGEIEETTESEGVSEEETTSEEENTTAQQETTTQQQTTTQQETTTQQQTTQQETTIQPQPSQPETQPSESETEESTPEPDIPDNSIQVSAELVSALAGGGNYAEFYQCIERHTFTNVSSPNAIITVEHNGLPVETYDRTYDEVTGTLVIEFMGHEIYTGEMGISSIALEDVDGRTATSGLTIQAPSLQSLDLTVTSNGDGTYTFAIQGEVIQPSHGSLTYEARIYPGGQQNVIDIFTGTGSTYSYSTVVRVDGAGTVYAYADLYAVWSMQTEADPMPLYLGAEDEVGYDVSSLAFTLKSDTSTDYDGTVYTYYPNPYEYEVAAVFAGLGEDITPLSVAFVRAKAERRLGDNLEYFYEYIGNPETVATVNDLVVEKDGTIHASYLLPDQSNEENYGDALTEGERHEWTAILTYQDSTGGEHQMNLTDYLESPTYNGVRGDGTLRRLEDGSYEAELDLWFNVLGGSHGGFVLDYVSLINNSLGGYELDVQTWSMEDGILRVKGTAPELDGYSYSYNVYAYWALTNERSNVTTGSSVVFMTPSHGFQTTPIVDDTNTIVGYETMETFTFAGASQWEYELLSVEVSDPDNVRDLVAEYDVDTHEIRVSFVRVNQQLNNQVKSAVTVTYQEGFTYEDGFESSGESRTIETYEKYTVE